jgi:hypothetical protein
VPSRSWRRISLVVARAATPLVSASSGGLPALSAPELDVVPALNPRPTSLRRSAGQASSGSPSPPRLSWAAISFFFVGLASERYLFRRRGFCSLCERLSSSSREEGPKGGVGHVPGHPRSARGSVNTRRLDIRPRPAIRNNRAQGCSRGASALEFGAIPPYTAGGEENPYSPRPRCPTRRLCQRFVFCGIVVVRDRGRDRGNRGGPTGSCTVRTRELGPVNLSSGPDRPSEPFFGRWLSRPAPPKICRIVAGCSLRNSASKDGLGACRRIGSLDLEPRPTPAENTIRHGFVCGQAHAGRKTPG